jgi:ADP-heptose:LPS heptosyltransferase
MGAALGVNMVALHGPTSVHRWGPVSKKAYNVFPKNAQCGYLHFGYEYHKSKVNCMELITVDEVMKAVIEQFAKKC